MILNCESFYYINQGWCGTCVPEAKPGESGFCPNLLQRDNSDPPKVEETAQPDPDSGWGWCGEKCFHKSHRTVQAQYLLTTKVQVGSLSLYDSMTSMNQILQESC